MPALTIRNSPEEAHRALRVRAEENGRSTVAEFRDLLAKTMRPGRRVKLGSLLAGMGRDAGLADEDVEAILRHRDRMPAAPKKLE